MERGKAVKKAIVEHVLEKPCRTERTTHMEAFHNFMEAYSENQNSGAPCMVPSDFRKEQKNKQPVA